MSTVTWSLQHKRDTAANFTSNNPTLLAGQLGIETDGLTTTPKFKIGDGVTAWTGLPYFYGGSLSAQDIANVLSVGNDTGGASLKMNTGTTYYGATNTTHIQYVVGLELHNSTANTLVNLTDAGLWKVDAIQYMPNLTASRILGLDVSKNIVSPYTTTGSGTELALSTSPTFVTDITTPLVIGGKNASDNLTINSTSHATKGKIYLGGASGLTFNELTNTVSIGNDSQTVTIAGVTYSVGLSNHNSSGTYINNEIHASSNTATLGAVQVGTRSRGTYGTPLVVQSGDNLFDVYSVGFDGTDYAIATAIEHEVDNTVGANQVPGRIKFSTANSVGTLTEAMRINSSQQVSIGNYATPSAQRLVTIGQDTAYISFGSLVGATSFAAIYLNRATPSTNNASIYSSGSGTKFNDESSAILSVSTTDRLVVQTYEITLKNGIATSGAYTPLTLTVPANTGQTASTEIPNFKVTGNTKTWAAGALGTQRWNYLTANTAAFASASTITNSYGLYVEAATAGSNATITNNYALGTNGGIFLNGTANTVLGNAALATNATTGFLHVPGCAGTPTGVPTLYTGMIPICADSTNNKLYIYSGGAWVALN